MLQTKPKYSFIVACILSLLITALLCTPGSEFPKSTWTDKIFLDKLIHTALFTALVIAWCRAYFKKMLTSNKQFYLKIAFIVLLYGIAMELIQEFFVPFRSFEIPDIIADGVGALIGYIISIKRFVQKQVQSSGVSKHGNAE